MDLDDMPKETQNAMQAYEKEVSLGCKDRLVKALNKKDLCVEEVLMAEFAGTTCALGNCLSFFPTKVRRSVMEKITDIALRSAKETAGSTGFLIQVQTERKR
jgi:hypothetical protein